jgi:hypothetical protein
MRLAVTLFPLMSSIIPLFHRLQKRKRGTSHVIKPSRRNLMKSSRSSGSLRRLEIALVVLILIGFSVTQAKAQNRTVNGIIIGAAVGSVVGLIVGSEMHNKSYSREQVYHKPVFRHPPPPSRRHYGYRDYSSHSSHARYNHRTVGKGRDIVVVSERHGHYRKSVQTVRRERGRRR